MIIDLINCISSNILIWFLVVVYLIPYLNTKLHKKEDFKSFDYKDYKNYIENGGLDMKKVDKEFWD